MHAIPSAQLRLTTKRLGTFPNAALFHGWRIAWQSSLGIGRRLSRRFEVDCDFINNELRRRQGGYGRGGRQKLETDTVDLLTGVWQNRTLGSPVTLQVINSDYKLERLNELERPRPGHADLTGAIKYSGSIRGVLERASARETAVRVAAGALARQMLRVFGIETIGYVTEIGGLAVSTPAGTIDEHRAARDASCVYTLAPQRDDEFRELIDRVTDEGDTVGGVMEVRVEGAADWFGDPRAVGPQARWPPGPSRHGGASHQRGRNRHGLPIRSPTRL